MLFTISLLWSREQTKIGSLFSPGPKVYLLFVALSSPLLCSAMRYYGITLFVAFLRRIIAPTRELKFENILQELVCSRKPILNLRHKNKFIDFISILWDRSTMDDQSLGGLQRLD